MVGIIEAETPCCVGRLHVVTFTAAHDKSAGWQPALRADWVAAANFAQALDEADRGADEMKFLAQLIFEEALEAEVQRLVLIGE